MFYSTETKKLMGEYFKWRRIIDGKSMRKVSADVNISYRTYRDIEHGIVKKNDDYYDDLQKYYFVNFDYDYKTYEECGALISNLYDAVENNQDDLVLELTHQIQSKISKYKNYVYYKELDISMGVIDKYYTNKEYVQIDKINDVINLMNLWNNHLSSILLEICERSNLNAHYSYEISDNLYKNIVIRDSISKSWYARECVMHVNYVDALEHYKEIIEYFDIQKNVHRKIQAMTRVFEIYRDIDQQKAKSYVKELNAILVDKLVSNVLKKNICYSIGMFYYYQEDYENAIKYYRQSYSYGKRDVCLLFIYACESKINKLQIEDFNPDKTFRHYPYIQYYEYKINAIGYNELETYLMSKLIPLLEKEIYKEPLWSMFEYELNQLVEKTRNYKNLRIYNEKMQHFTKNAA